MNETPEGAARPRNRRRVWLLALLALALAVLRSQVTQCSIVDEWSDIFPEGHPPPKAAP